MARPRHSGGGGSGQGARAAPAAPGDHRDGPGQPDAAARRPPSAHAAAAPRSPWMSGESSSPKRLTGQTITRRLADDVVHTDRAAVLVADVRAGVRRGRAVVTHHPEPALGHGDRAEGARTRSGCSRRCRARRAACRRRSRGPRRRSTATVWPAVAMTRLTKSSSLGRRHADGAAQPQQRAGEPVARLGDRDLRRPGVRALEDDDLAGLGLAEPVRDLVDQHPVAGAARCSRAASAPSSPRG